MRTAKTRRPRVRRQLRFDLDIARRLTEYSSASGQSETAVVQDAVCRFLDRTSDMTLVFTGMSQLTRMMQRIQRDLGVSLETFTVWLKWWFAHTPSIPEDGKDNARASSEVRYKQFVEHMAEHFSGGKRFLDDLPQEVIADPQELGRAAHDSTKAEQSASKLPPTSGDKK